MTRTEWTGLVAGQRDSTAEKLTITACLQQSPSGVSGSFMVLGADGQKWWVKTPQQQNQLDRALVTEFVVGRAGNMINAPVCSTSLIEITSDFAGWEYRPGHALFECVGNATAHVDNAIEKRPQLQHRSDDDNRRRHVGVFALYDWCWGGDEQWLHDTLGNMATYSHDHGWYLPETGPDWSVQTLEARVNESHQLAQDASGLDVTAIDYVAAALESVERESIARMLRSVPSEWNVSDEELECLGWFLEERAPSVAERLRSMQTANGG